MQARRVTLHRLQQLAAHTGAVHHRGAHLTVLQHRQLTTSSLRHNAPAAASNFRASSSALPHRVSVIGGGISGLVLAYYLRRYAVAASVPVAVNLFESQDRLGGWIKTQTRHKAGAHQHTSSSSDGDGATSTKSSFDSWLYEWGPHSYLSRGGAETLRLVAECGLQSEMIPADKSSAKRFIMLRGELTQLPSSWREILTFPLLPAIIKAVIKDVFAPKSTAQDESIYQFVSRRMNQQVADYLVDPLVGGVYGGNPKQLSVRSCFPQLWLADQQYGGLIRGMGKASKQLAKNHESQYRQPASLLAALEGADDWMASVSAKPISFTFQSGMQRLPQRLAEMLSQDEHVSIHTNTHATYISSNQKNSSSSSALEVHTRSGGAHAADQLFLTASAPSIAALLQQSSQQRALHTRTANFLANSLAHSLQSVGQSSVWMVHVGYTSSSDKENATHPSGFGCLVPTNERLNVLGVTFDSATFPQQSQPRQHRYSVFIGGDRHAYLTHQSRRTIMDLAVSFIRSHLGIQGEPTYVDAQLNVNCIPQYYTDHYQHIKQAEDLQSLLNRQFLPASDTSVNASAACVAPTPSEHAALPAPFHLLGTSLYGVSLNDCIRHAKRVAHNHVKELVKQHSITVRPAVPT